MGQCWGWWATCGFGGLRVLWSSRVPPLELGARMRGRWVGLGWASTEKVGAVHGLPAYPGFWACVASSGTGASTRIVGPGYSDEGRRGGWGQAGRALKEY